MSNNLLIRLVHFWYPSALTIFLRVWHNLLNVLEEDLAVSLMWKLLFVPLFHDSSFVGRILSFIFRLTRIILGFIAYLSASIAMIVFALLWFVSPVLLFLPSFTLISLIFKGIFLFGTALFFLKLNSHPPGLVKYVKAEQLWQATFLKKEDLSFSKLKKDQEVQELLTSLELDSNALEDYNIPITFELELMVWKLAINNKAKYITPAYFFVAMLISIPLIDQKLLKINLQALDFKNALSFLENKRNKYRTVYIWDEDFAIAHLRGINRGWLGAPTPTLDLVADDLTEQVSHYSTPDFIGREIIISEVVNILSQGTNENVVVVAPPGAGKTTLVRFLAAKIVAGDAPPALATKRLVSLDLARLLANVTSQGELAGRIKDIFDEVSFTQNIIIFVDEIQNMGIGEVSTSFNLYSLMLPYLESNNFQFIAATEPENYAKILEKNSAFARVFTKIELPPATPDETLKILEDTAINLEKTQHIRITYLAIKLLVDLSVKVFHARVLPDSALVILNEAQTVGKGYITSELVRQVISKRVNIPVDAIAQNQRELLLNLEGQIHSKMIDQEQAVKSVANALRRAAVSLREAQRPIGSFLFVGPTGVGKTELAKTLAQVYFKDKGAFIRFDMSEYQTVESINRLIGDRENLGELTEAVRNKPYALLLLDEFEKANHKLLNLFLQVLDDGRLTDDSGKTIDFTNTIIIATSNAASLLIAESIKNNESSEVLHTKVKDALLKILKPELINRFDDVVIFKPLSQVDLEKIVKLKLTDLSKLLEDQGYLVDFDPRLISELAKRGYDPVLGARPLRRLIQDTLEAKLSTMILEGKLPKGEPFTARTDLLA